MVWNEVILSRFSVRLLCFIQVYVGMVVTYFLAALVLVCVDVMVMSSA